MAGQQELLQHIRSNSLPTGSHPLAVQFEDELQNMKRWASSTEASTSQGSEMLCVGLKGLVKLHSCVGNLLSMPCNQRAIARCKNEKWLSDELDLTVRLLDMCSMARDSLSLVKEQAQEVESTLRTKRVGDKTKLQGYTSSCKKATKVVTKCSKELKQMNDKSVAHPEMVNDEDLCLVVKAFKEVREITIRVFQSIFGTISSSKNGGYWSLVSKAMSLKNKNVSQASMVASFVDLCKKMSTQDVDALEAQKQIKDLECNVAATESGLESLFHALIHNRVALLNIVTV